MPYDGHSFSGWTQHGLVLSLRNLALVLHDYN